VVVIKT